MSRVIVVQETDVDFSDAGKYGEVEFLTVSGRDDFNNNLVSPANERMLAHLSTGLRGFDEEDDYLIPTGSPYIQAAVFWMLGHRGVRQLHILRWSNRDRRYVPMWLKLRQETVNG